MLLPAAIVKFESFVILTSGMPLVGVLLSANAIRWIKNQSAKNLA
jgi:hypothetical protein